NCALDLSNLAVTVEPTGRCCIASPSSCQVITAGACATAGGVYGGDNAACSTPGPNQHTSARNNVNIPIPDADATGITDSVTVPAGDNYIVGDIRVDVDIPDHTFIGDLRIDLTN